jgi:methylmalonyl-CoA mutase cobalamin-binding domain/chain
MAEDVTLVEALAQCREDHVKALVRQKIEAGVPATEIVAECNQGMVELGNRFAAGDCFLPELMFGGMVMKSVMAELGPSLGKQAERPNVGKVVMGSVQHDVHDIGKDIVVMMLRGAGFDVVDLGVDVAPEAFVDAVRAHQPVVVGLSVLLTTCFKSVMATVQALRTAGLRDKVSVMVGGAAASDLLSQNAGCDYYGKTAVDGMKYACRLAGVA